MPGCSVDMTMYPGLAAVPWYKVVVEPGDCLYLPYGWIHQVSHVLAIVHQVSLVCVCVCVCR